MPKVKIARKSTVIDMTAMCDVAFLLLTFFILTATARQPEPLQVDTPASTVIFKQPDTDLGILTVGKGKVFFGVKGQKIRGRMLQLMGERYKMQFTPEEINRFSLIESFGVPVGNLHELIAMKNDDRAKPGVQPGIPVDTASDKSELSFWIHDARVATKQIDNAEMRISIKGDAREEYPAIKKVIKALQDQEINQFSLITALRGGEEKKK